jgi:ribose transport system ATP-binding protein
VPTRPTADVVLRASGVSKAFGGVQALDEVDFALHEREVHGLLGQNGAGKSTLVKIINGVHAPDAGSLEIAGKVVELDSTTDARDVGVAMVFQEFSLIPTLSVAQNVFLNAEPRRARAFIDDRATVRRTRELLDRLGVDIDPGTKVGSLPVGSQQLVEIAKAMSRAPSILILDEPTASLSQAEVATLFKTIDVLTGQGVSIIYISHHLQEVLTVCDTITVLRDGRLQLTGPAAGLDLESLVDAITGTSAADRQQKGEARPPVDRSVPAALELHGWSLGGRLVDIDLVLHPGEVVGVAGLLGSGRTSLLRSIVGLEPDVRGTLIRNGERMRLGSPTEALKRGVAYVPEDRRRHGMVVGQSVQANLLMTVWERMAQHFLISESRATATSEELIDRLGVKTSGQHQLIEFLSGGNQQKVVVGRSLARGPNVLLLDDPTAGIDIGSRRDLLGHVRRFADEGGAVIVVSSELGDLGRIADRVAVLAHGAIIRMLDRDAGDVLSEANLLTAIHHEAGAAA